MPTKNDRAVARDQFQRVSDCIGTEGLPSVSLLSFEGQSAFQILVATLISARTRDEVTLSASRRFAAVFPDPISLIQADADKIAQLIYPVAFYKQKARHLLQLGFLLQNQFGGAVPSTVEKLLTLPGVGIKTANLVLGLAFNTPAICVDTHVHRIANRTGWIASKDVHQTEVQLQDLFPKELWIILNTVLVSFGQKVCTPQSPHCSSCCLGIEGTCPRVGVISSR